jgi:LacI family transcriptional regulator
MQDVAQRAGVSATTVSHIINNTRYVSEPIKERVRSAIEELGYRPYGVARSLRTKRTKTVGLIIPDNTNAYFAEISRFIEDACFRSGQSVITCNSEQDPKKELVYIQLLQDKGVDGIVFVSTGGDTGAIQTLSRQHVPVVLVDRDLGKTANEGELRFDTVLVNNHYGGYLATRHLLELGHERIACITGPPDVTPSTERLEGYREALSESDIDPDCSLIEQGNFQVDSGYEAFRTFIDSAHQPTALFACNDLMAVGAMFAAFEAGVRVPQDISVVGFDDIRLASYYIPPLTTVRQPKDLIAGRAVDLLLNRIAYGAEPDHRDTVDPELVPRGSTAAPVASTHGYRFAGESHE